MTNDEDSLVRAIEAITDAPCAVTDVEVRYTYLDKNNIRTMRVLPLVQARQDERVLLTLRKALMYARLDHVGVAPVIPPSVVYDALDQLVRAIEAEDCGVTDTELIWPALVQARVVLATVTK